MKTIIMKTIIMKTIINNMIFLVYQHENLVGGFNPSEKYEFVSWEGLSHIWNEKIKAMFETTKQKLIKWQSFGCWKIMVWKKKCLVTSGMPRVWWDAWAKGPDPCPGAFFWTGKSMGKWWENHGAFNKNGWWLGLGWTKTEGFLVEAHKSGYHMM